MSTSARTDFFVSYNQHDRGWAEWVAWQLETAGYVTLIQAWDFGPGSNFVIAMHTGLEASERVLLIVSNNYLKSKFGSAEWAAIFAKDPDGTRKRVLPVRVEDCSPDGLLKSIVYIDLVGMNEQSAAAALLDGVREGRQKPVRAPTFPPSSRPPAFPPDGAAHQPAVKVETARVQYTMVVSGTINADDKALIEAMVEHLRRVSKDASLTLIKVEKGSVRLVLEGTRHGFERLVELVGSGELKELVGREVQDLKPSREGDAGEEGYESALYHVLLRFAKNVLTSWEGNVDLEPRELVSEAFLRSRQRWGGSEAVATRAMVATTVWQMRRFTIDSVRAAASRMRSNPDSRSRLFNDVSVPARDVAAKIDLERALARLFERNRIGAEVLELTYFAGLSIREAAQVLNISDTAARVRLWKARQYLRAELSKGESTPEE